MCTLSFLPLLFLFDQDDWCEGFSLAGGGSAAGGSSSSSSHPRKKKRLGEPIARGSGGASRSVSSSSPPPSVSTTASISGGSAGTKKTWDTTPWSERNAPTCEVSDWLRCSAVCDCSGVFDSFLTLLYRCCVVCCLPVHKFSFLVAVPSAVLRLPMFLCSALLSFESTNAPPANALQCTSTVKI